MPFSSLAWTICRRCSDCLSNIKTTNYPEIWFYAVNMLQNAAKMFFFDLAAAEIAALT